jgi:hypothetical protein
LFGLLFVCLFVVWFLSGVLLHVRCLFVCGCCLLQSNCWL